jgi:hypothetical protein
VADEYNVRVVDDDRINETELLDGSGDFIALLWRVLARVARIDDEEIGR